MELNACDTPPLKRSPLPFTHGPSGGGQCTPTYMVPAICRGRPWGYEMSILFPEGLAVDVRSFRLA